MKKRWIALTLGLTLALGTSMTSLAAGWQQNSTGWWYGTNADNSTWHSNGWQWIDGNGDGVAECYYFDANGYMLANTTTPDGYMVNANGAWTIDNFTQTKVVEKNDPADIPATDPATGYNELGVSLAVVDMLENTIEENAAIYGVKNKTEYEASSEILVEYNNGIKINYFKGMPDIAYSKIPSTILKGLDDSLMGNGDAQDKLNNLKINGYTDSYSDGTIAISNIDKYQAHWYPSSRLDISIMAKYR